MPAVDDYIENTLIPKHEGVVKKTDPATDIQALTDMLAGLDIIQIMNGYECNGTDFFMR